MKTIRYVLWALVAVAGFGLGALSLDLFGTQQTVSGKAAIGGEFSLVNHKGERVDQTIFKGKPSVVYFGFTQCPEICPTTLLDMAGWAEALGTDGDKFNYVFFTVDPERDTPEVVADYMSAFDPRFIGLTGTPDEVKTALKAYRVYARKVELDDGDYTMDHTAAVYLLDAKGDFFGTVAYGEQQQNALAKLKRLLPSS
ncbi:SCO family protein [Coralliovum pocilloporae]|uniref:SCO family protein n=1 Tax=Coralliovum pocilloporae TaxID=3066369 RepID=UPI003307A1E7